MREFDSDYESEEEEEPRSKKLKSVRNEEVSKSTDQVYIYDTDQSERLCLGTKK